MKASYSPSSGELLALPVRRLDVGLRLDRTDDADLAPFDPLAVGAVALAEDDEEAARLHAAGRVVVTDGVDDTLTVT